MPQEYGLHRLATPELKRSVIKLPEGMSLNPSSANGLEGCSEAQIGYKGDGFPMPAPMRFDETQPACPSGSGTARQNPRFRTRTLSSDAGRDQKVDTRRAKESAMACFAAPGSSARATTMPVSPNTARAWEISEPEGTSAPELKRTVVTLARGVNVNSASANGLEACSKEQMGLLTTVALVPNLFFSLHAGSWVDRRAGRRQVMLATDVGRGLLIATVPVAYAFGHLTWVHLYVVAFGTGAAQ